MSHWFQKNLGDAMLAEVQLDDIRALFMTVYEKTYRPREMAIFIRHESEGHLHCELKVYFSPASAAVAAAVEATPCRTPSPESLGLLAGSEEAWTLLFPARRG